MDTTSHSLLIRLKSAENDPAAWGRFVELYTPLIYYWARKNGLQPSDASDLVQEVLTTLVDKLPEFQLDPSKSFRGWLRAVTLNKWREMHRRKSISQVNPTTSQWCNIADKQDDFWEREYLQHLAHRGMQLAKPLFDSKTWLALQDYVMAGGPAAEIAEKHNVSVWTVYSAKSRLLAYLREELDGLLD